MHDDDAAPVCASYTIYICVGWGGGGGVVGGLVSSENIIIAQQ